MLISTASGLVSSLIQGVLTNGTILNIRLRGDLTIHYLHLINMHMATVTLAYLWKILSFLVLCICASSGHATNGAECEVKWDGCWSWGLNIRGTPTADTSHTFLHLKLGQKGIGQRKATYHQ